MQTRILVFLLSFTFAASAFASCGSSSCPLDLHALAFADTSRLTLDLSFQYIEQDHLRHQRGIFDVEHDELRTVNRLTTFQLTSRLSPDWQFSVTASYVSRAHDHIEAASGEPEDWSFSAFGDAAVQARYRVSPSIWLSAGAKLPTGARHESNGDEQAEVTIQPGTGSTDLLFGATWQGGIIRDTALGGPMGNATLIPLFASINYRHNGRGTHDYRRGDEVQVSAGSEYPLAPSLHLIGQLNLRHAQKDDVGATKENALLTGGTYLYLSPGLRVVAGHGASVYTYVQIPLVQRVNGIQLVSRANYLVGIQQRF